MVRGRRPDGVVFYSFRRRWPGIVAAGLGLVTLITVWSLAGFILATLAAFVVGGLSYRYFHGVGRGY